MLFKAKNLQDMSCPCTWVHARTNNIYIL